jgi:hypothetical protein
VLPGAGDSRACKLVARPHRGDGRGASRALVLGKESAIIALR